MDTSKWLELAKSTDVGRYNLTGGWRHKDRLYYCDGHRMHYEVKLAEVATPVSTTGLDASMMPNFETIIPAEETLQEIYSISHNERAHLVRWLKAVNSADKKAVIKLSANESGMMLEVKSVGELVATVQLKIGGYVEKEDSFRCLCQLKYLLDAVSMANHCYTTFYKTSVKESNSLTIRSSTYCALLMLMKLD